MYYGDVALVPSLTTTPEHPFFTAEHGWVAAADLAFTDTIWSADCSWGTVDQLVLRSDPQPMYNLTVAIAHTYFVGHGQWLVHNMCKVPEEVDPLLDYIEKHRGWAPEGVHHNKVYRNKEGHDLTPGDWIEYDLTSSGKSVGKSRNDDIQRLIISRQSGEVKYTPDHYQTMIDVDRIMPQDWHQREVNK